MKRRARKMPNWVAGLLAVVLVVIANYFAWGGALPWKDDYELKAMVTSGLDLSTRSPVRIAGVEVGKVKKVERGPGNTAIVTMKIEEPGLPIHEDATIKVRPRIFLEGNFFVDLRPGTPGSKAVESGHTLPLSQTAVAVQFDEVLSTLEKGTRQNLQTLLKEYRTGLAGGGAEALRSQLPDWGPTFTNIALAAEATRGEEPHDLSGFIDGGAETAEAVASRDQQLAELITGLNRTVGALASKRTQLEASLPALNSLLDEAPDALVDIDAALPETRALAIEVRPALREAPETLRLAKPVLAQARALVSKGELPALLGQLDPAIDDLQPLLPRLTTTFDQLQPVTECLRRNAVPTLKTPIEDPPHSTGQPAYRELLHGYVGLASASQNFDGNGPAVRYHAGFGDQLVSLGQVPTVGEAVVGLTSEPLLGSRPKKPSKKPPFRPDVPCSTQEPPNLKAETGPAPRQQKVSLDVPKVELPKELRTR